MNKESYRYLTALALILLLGKAHAENWSADELMRGFSQVSAQIAHGDLQAAEAGLDTLRQNNSNLDARLEQYQRELTTAYLQRAQQQLQAGDPRAASATLAQGQRHLQAASPALKAQYQASLAAAAAGTSASVPAQSAAAPTPAAKQASPEEQRNEVERRLREAEATIARQEAEHARLQKLAAQQAAQLEAEAKAKAEAEAEASRQLAAAQAKPEPEAPASLIDPSAASSNVPMPMLDSNDRDSLRDLLDQVATDVVAFDCAVRLEVREAKDYRFVAALLSARIKKLDPGFAPQFSSVLKPDQEPRLVLSPQSNG